MRGVFEVDTFKQVLIAVGNTEIDRTGVGRSVNETKPSLPGGHWSQVGASDRQLQAVTGAGDENLIGLSGLKIEIRVDGCLIDRRILGRDANVPSVATWHSRVLGGGAVG